MCAFVSMPIVSYSYMYTYLYKNTCTLHVGIVICTCADTYRNKIYSDTIGPREVSRCPDLKYTMGSLGMHKVSCT